MLSDCAGMKTTYVTCMKTGKQIAFYVLGTLDPQDFGIERRNTTSTGEIAFEKYFIWRGFDNWIVEAVAHDRWMVMNRGCAFFVLYDCLFFFTLFLFAPWWGCFRAKNLWLDFVWCTSSRDKCVQDSGGRKIGLQTSSPSNHFIFTGWLCSNRLSRACRSSTANVKFLLVRQNIQALVERTFFQELGMIGIYMNWYGGMLKRCRVDLPTAPTPQTGVPMFDNPLIYFFWNATPAATWNRNREPKSKAYDRDKSGNC